MGAVNVGIGLKALDFQHNGATDSCITVRPERHKEKWEKWSAGIENIFLRCFVREYMSINTVKITAAIPEALRVV